MTRLFALGLIYLTLFSSNIVNGDKLYPVNIKGKYGFINRKGKIKIKPEFDIAKPMNEGLAYVESGDKKGYIDSKGNWKIIFVTKREYINFEQYLNGDKQKIKNINYCYPFSEGYAVISSANKYGYCNTSGKIVIPMRYTSANSFREGLAGVGIDKKGKKYYGFIDSKGKWIINPEYDFVFAFSDGLAAVKKEDKWGFINMKGESMIKNKYRAVWSFSEGLAPVCKKNIWGCVDKNDTVVIPFEFKRINSFSEGLAIASDDSGQYGYINKKGSFVIPPSFDNCLDFSEGLASVSKNDKWGYIDKKGNYVVPVQYKNCYSFDGGIARVIISGHKYMMNGEYGYINKKGEFIFRDNGKKRNNGDTLH